MRLNPTDGRSDSPLLSQDDAVLTAILQQMDPRGMDESTTDDDNASQTTEDDPQIPAPAPVQSHPAVPPPPPGAQIQASTNQAAPRERSNYRLRHTLRGHTQSVSAVKFSPDGTLLASCGAYSCSSRMLGFLVCGVAHVL